MGQRVQSLARDDARFEIAAALGRENAAAHGHEAGFRGDVVIDFSSPDGAMRAMEIALRERAALLVGTTGLSRGNLRVLDDAARSIAVMIAANTARGVAVVTHLVTEAARLLGERFDVDLLETHHSAKRDAPSGTALRLIDALRDCAGLTLARDRVHSIRAGTVIGEHVIRFSGPGENLEISHAVADRDVFAAGALDAAAWLHGRPPARYTIGQALGLEPEGGSTPDDR
jgi:4-hydroxy-tetrahydrodipicolinate reductase